MVWWDRCTGRRQAAYRIYRAVEEAEKYLSQLIEITGQPSSLEGSAQRRGQYQTSLTSTLEEVTPQLQRLMRAG